MARRAGKLSLGHDAAKASLVAGRAQLCILSCDTSERLKDEFKNLSEANEGKTPIIISNRTMLELGHAVGSKAGVIAVDDAGFSKRLEQLSSDSDTM